MEDMVWVVKYGQGDEPEVKVAVIANSDDEAVEIVTERVGLTGGDYYCYADSLVDILREKEMI